jgi:hypothetical protein
VVRRCVSLLFEDSTARTAALEKFRHRSTVLILL